MPYRRPNNYGRIKPPFGADLNLSHPLAKNTAYFLLLNENGGSGGAAQGTGAYLYDSTGQHVPARGPILWTQSPYGIAVTRNGSNAGIVINPSITLSVPFTYRVRFKPVSGDLDANYHNMGTNGSSNGFWVKSAKLDYYTGTDHLANTTLVAGTYYEYVVTVTSTTTNYYVNGIADGNFSITSTTQIWNGILADGGATSETFGGTLDYMQLINGIAWTKDQAMQAYISPFSMFVPPVEDLRQSPVSSATSLFLQNPLTGIYSGGPFRANPVG